MEVAVKQFDQFPWSSFHICWKHYWIVSGVWVNWIYLLSVRFETFITPNFMPGEIEHCSRYEEKKGNPARSVLLCFHCLIFITYNYYIYNKADNIYKWYSQTLKIQNSFSFYMHISTWEQSKAFENICACIYFRKYLFVHSSVIFI